MMGEVLFLWGIWFDDLKRDEVLWESLSMGKEMFALDYKIKKIYWKINKGISGSSISLIL